MKKRGWINPKEYEFEDVMRMISYATKPTSLAVFNIALSQYMVSQKDDGAIYFMVAAFFYIYITFIISTHMEYFSITREDKPEELEKEMRDISFRIVLCFGVAASLNLMGLFKLLAVWAGLIA